eukprot:SM000014S00240  [mRNA]  locus=s14:174410:174961:- [translate_table: standard]
MTTHRESGLGKYTISRAADTLSALQGYLADSVSPELGSIVFSTASAQPSKEVQLPTRSVTPTSSTSVVFSSYLNHGLALTQHGAGLWPLRRCRLWPSVSWESYDRHLHYWQHPHCFNLHQGWSILKASFCTNTGVISICLVFSHIL